MRQDTGQVVEEVQGDRLLESCEGGALVGVGGDAAEDDEEERVEEEEEHSGPQEVLLGEELGDGAAQGNSCDTHRSNRGQNVGNRGLALPRTNKRGQGGGQGIGFWAGWVQEDKR